MTSLKLKEQKKTLLNQERKVIDVFKTITFAEGVDSWKFVYFPLYMCESERVRVLHWVYYTVLSSGKMSTMHLRLPSANVQQPQRRRRTALNQMEKNSIWSDKYLFLKDPALLVPLRVLAIRSVTTKRSSQLIQPGSDICFHLQADCFGFAALSQTFSALHLLSQEHRIEPSAYILRDF